MTAPQPVIVVSVDCEFDGPSTANGALRSIGAVAYLDDAEVGEFYRVLIPDRPGHPDTLGWWSLQGEAWAELHRDMVEPHIAMLHFRDWLVDLPGKPMMLAWPDSADWPWVNHYLWEYTGGNPLGYKGLCQGSFACGLIRNETALLGHREESSFPEEWFPEPLMKHHALHDARAQGQGWLAMRRWAASTSAGGA